VHMSFTTGPGLTGFSLLQHEYDRDDRDSYVRFQKVLPLQRGSTSRGYTTVSRQTRNSTARRMWLTGLRGLQMPTSMRWYVSFEILLDEVWNADRETGHV
jgi:hypothetical protein